MTKQRRGCRIIGCMDVHKALGYCNSHYEQMRVKGTIRIADTGCFQSGCDGHHYARGYCKKHYESRRRKEHGKK